MWLCCYMCRMRIGKQAWSVTSAVVSNWEDLWRSQEVTYTYANSGNMSETIQDSNVVTADHLLEVMYGLSNRAFSDDLEWLSSACTNRKSYLGSCKSVGTTGMLLQCAWNRVLVPFDFSTGRCGYYLHLGLVHIIKTKLESVSLSDLSCHSKAANITILFANSKHGSKLPHLYQSLVCHKCKSYLLCLEFAYKILIFTVLERQLLQLRGTDSSCLFIIFAVLLRKI